MPELPQVNDTPDRCAECANFRAAPKTWPEVVGYLILHPRTLALVALAACAFVALDCRKIF